MTVTVLPVTPISEVQGPGASSPLAGTDVAVEAIVTSLFTTDDVTSGFFLQEEDADADDSPATSEGVFVTCTTACLEAPAAGDLVVVAGEVVEDFGLTRIRATSPGVIAVVSSGNDRPTAATAELPAAAGTNSAATFESIESMVTTVPGTLVVSEFFELARFGQIELTAGARPLPVHPRRRAEHRRVPGPPRRAGAADDHPRRRQRRPERRHQRRPRRALPVPGARACP